jgi:hypothetical protein
LRKLGGGCGASWQQQQIHRHQKRVDSKLKEKEDKDDINNFFSKLEKTTPGGKNFQPGWL